VIKREDLVPYEGREHAKAKHALLGNYIQRYAMILGVSGAPSLVFVDAFAGPWQSSTNDLSDTSFGLSLRTLARCADTLVQFQKQPNIRALWIENDPGAFATLSQAARRSSNSRISIETEQGRFQDKIDRIVQFVGNDAYAFIFVDPKGYTGLIEPSILAPLLRLPRAELLINYMWDHIRFALGRPNEAGHVENMKRLFGRHTDQLFLLRDGAEREEASLMAFEDELREACGQTKRGKLRVLSYPIRSTHGQQYPKYYLVHTTHSAKGLVTFAEQCDRTELIQSSIFQIANLVRRDRQSATTDMFADQIQPEPSVAEPATQPWLDVLKAPGNELRVDAACWAALLEAGRCLPSALQQGARTLIQEGVLENVDARRLRPKKVVDYEKSERIRRIK
jgi:three-Cys-motif partner protein